MNKTLVSIIVPVFNASKYINDTLMSLVRQSYKNIEIICINDGSTDNSLEILMDLASTDSRISVHNRTNNGVSNTRNFGISVSNGSYIIFCDSDDMYVENAVEILLEKIRLYKSNIVKSSWHVFGEIDRDVVFSEKSINPIKLMKRTILGKKIGYRNVIGAIYDREILMNTKFVETLNKGEDELFSLELFKKNDVKVKFISDVLYHYRQNNSSLTRKKVTEKDLDVCSLFFKMLHDMYDDFDMKFEKYTLSDKVQWFINDVALTAKYSKNYCDFQVTMSNITKFYNDNVFLSKLSLVRIVFLSIQLRFKIGFIIYKISNRLFYEIMKGV